jgi:hypothetical protein
MQDLMNNHQFSFSKFRPEQIGLGAIENGIAFQLLCFDIFQSKHNTILPLSNEYILTSYPPNRKDGGIDIVAEKRKNKRIEIFIQCKLGLNKNGTDLIIDGIITELGNALNRDTIPEQYKPWQACKFISKYFICLARESSNLQVTTRNQKKIESLFSEISRNEKFKHLANIEIRVLFWNDLKIILEKDAHLYHKWIKGEPSGLSFIKSSSRNVSEKKIPAQFKDYLNEDSLNYISRKEFRYRLPENQKKIFHDEDSLFTILKSSTYIGIVIHGQGGIGKTRLMLELGRLATQVRYSVFEVDKDYNDMDELISFLKPTGKYILLFDYIEEQKLFDKVVKWITDKTFDHISVVANCRNSFLHEVQGNYTDQLFYIDIGLRDKFGNVNTLENKYKKEIILSIIDSISDKNLSAKLKSDAILKTFYQARPSFAAFIKYIHQKNPVGDFSIATDETFSNWLIKKLKLSIVKDIRYRDFFENKKYVFQLLSCLPANKNTVSILEQMNQGEIVFADELNKLTKDGWVDKIDSSLQVVHDTVNDSLFVEFLKHFQFDKYYINIFLDFSWRANSISSMMWSIQRIWEEVPENKQPLMQKAIINFLDKILNADSVRLNWIKYKIDNSRLLEEEDRIKLLLKHRNIFKETFALEKFGSSIGFCMNWVFKYVFDSTHLKEYSNGLRQLYFDEWNIEGRFDDSVIDTSKGGKIISGYINLYGIDDYINQKFYEYIQNAKCSSSNLEPLSLTFVSWLNRNGQITSQLTELIISWFNVFENEKCTEVNPEYLMRSWIIKGNDTAAISRHIKAFLEDSNDLQNKAELIRFWLSKSDDLSLVEPFIKECLTEELFPKTAYYIIGYWLHKSANPLLVKPFLIKWLNYPVEPHISSFIFRHWLEKGDDPNILIEPLKKWLNIETSQDSIGNILSRFIQKKEGSNELKDEIINWIVHNTFNSNSINVLGFMLEYLSDKSLLTTLEIPTRQILQNFSSLNEAGFIIDHWLSKGGNISTIDPFINNWLAKFWNSRHASQIISNWLAKGNCIKVKEFIVPFLEIFGKQKEMSTLMFYWLMYGDDPYLIKEFIKPFFAIKENQISPESRYLITYWLEDTSLPLLVKDAIKPWLASNWFNSEGSIRVCAFWLQKGDDINLVEDYVKNHFYDFADQNGSNRVISYWIDNGGELKLIEKCVEKYIYKANSEINEIYIVKSWLKKKGDLSIVRNYIRDRFIMYCDDKNSYGVISLWFENKGSFETIKDAVIKYLEFYSYEASFAIVGWIELGNDFDLIKDFLIVWLDKNLLNTADSSFVMASALETGKGFVAVREKAIEWLNHFGKTYNAKFPLSSWLKFKGREDSKEIEQWIFYWVENLYDPTKHNWRDDLLFGYVP